MRTMLPGHLYKLVPLPGRFFIVRVDTVNGGEYGCRILAGWDSSKGSIWNCHPVYLKGYYDWAVEDLTVADLMLYVSAPFVSLELGRILKGSSR